jgi:ATP-dependent Lhr-like helicase
MQDSLPFGPATATWFRRTFEGPTEVQRRGWEAIARGDDALLIAPTGSGKTLAAFLVALDALGRAPRAEGQLPGWRTVYVSPLKALVYDIERNLHAPLRGISVTAGQLGLPFSPPAVDVRTGDTLQPERRRQAQHPGDILVTTPESLYLLLTSGARDRLRSVETLIVDEIHALAPSRRGTHLMLSVARLEHLLGERRLQKIGLSATVSPIADVAAFLTGGAPATIIDTHAPPRLDLAVEVPVPDLTRPWVVDAPPAPLPPGPLAAASRAPAGLAPAPDGLASGPLLGAASADLSPDERASIWPILEPEIARLILAHRATIVFVNARGLAERLAQRLHELLVEAGHTTADAPLIRAHHGSIAHAQRREIEEGLKGGALRGIVATSSLELGIDMGTIDLVIQVAAPDSVARGLQRVGRAGHQVGGISIGRVFPKHRADLAIATVIADLMKKGAIEPIGIPRQPLDVLAQQIVAMVAMEPWTVDALEALLRRTFSYRELPRELLLATLDMLAGVFPTTETADLRPRLNWDRATDILTPRKGSRLLAVTNGGTIADRGLYGVFLAGEEGKKAVRVGELDEEMVHEARVGETFILGATTWRIAEITRDRVVVTPAPGEPGKLPFWKGEGPGRPLETGRALGAFYRQLASMTAGEADAWLAAHYPVDASARDNLIDHVATQRAATGVVPTDRDIVIEIFRDQLGDHRLCILSPFGARVHAPWALALEELLGRRSGVEVQSLWTDDGIAIRFADGTAPPRWDDLAIAPEDVDDLIVERLGQSPLFAAMFRESAGRSLLLPRRSPDRRAPLWQQRLRAQQLLAAVRRHARFPVILETYRTCLKDTFDVPALKTLLHDIQTRRVRVHVVETRDASPFSRSIAFAFVQTYMYEADQPSAERRAHALTLDRQLLRELLGDDGERALFDASVLAEIEAELSGRVAPYAPTDADGLHDLARRRCGLRREELEAAATAGGLSAAALDEALEALSRSRRVAPVRVGGAPLWIAVEDAALYRDALGALPPPGLPERLLLEVDRPLEALIGRLAAARIPFRIQSIAERLGLPSDLLDAPVDALLASGRLARGPFHPDIPGHVLCDAELLRRIRRRMLATLRREVAPVDAATYARFLGAWHGLDDGTRGAHRLEDALSRLEGFALPISELETRILPARVPGYRPAMLDALFAAGELVWVGCGALGPKDGRIALYRRASVDALLTPPPDDAAPRGPLHDRLLAFLAARGSAFAQDLLVRVAHPVGASAAELTAAVWDLAFAGFITNDTLLPVRALTAGQRAVRVRGQAPPSLTGRWSLVRSLVFEPPPDTVRLVARVQRMVERHGVLTRDVVELEQVEGGFGALHEGLRALEEKGALRRGHFVDGLHGIQFAAPGLVDRLRAHRGEGEGEGRFALLSAVDPANPWGSLFPWPETAEGVGRPRRQAGASVLLARGEPRLWVASKGDRIVTFPAAREDDAEAIASLEALAPLAGGRSGGLVVTHVDGADPRTGRWAERLRLAGFRSSHKGFVRFEAAAPRAAPRPARGGHAPPDLGYGPPPSPVSAPASTPAGAFEVAPPSEEAPEDDRFARRFAERRSLNFKRRPR